MDIEKNDVDITKLFLWEGEVDIVDQHQNEVGKVYMRLVGDKDLNKSRVYSLRKSAELRNKLHTEGSDEHTAFIKGITLNSKESLVAGVKLLEMADLSNDARRNALVKFPVEPDSDASLEEQEKYQKKVDEFPDKFSELVAKELEKLLKSEDKRLDKLSDKELQDLYQALTINYVCQEEMGRAFSDMCIFKGTYKDKEYKKKLFTTFTKYENIATEVRDQLREGYTQLELGMSELKKLQEATLSPPLGEFPEGIGE